MSNARQIDGPAAMFAAHAHEVPGPSAPAHRFLTDAEVVAAVEEIGVDLYAWGGGYAWRVGKEPGLIQQPAGRTLAEAARSAATLAGLSITANARRWFAVAGWLAYRLEEAGEIIQHRASGVSLWGCTDPDFDPELSPVLADIFEAVAHTLQPQPGLAEGSVADVLAGLFPRRVAA